MSQSLANVLLHVVFSTKNRAPFLKDAELREELNAYMVGTLANLNCPSLIIRCVEDHLHCLCQLSRTMSIAKLNRHESNSTSATFGIGPGIPPRWGFASSLAGYPGLRCAAPWAIEFRPIRG